MSELPGEAPLEDVDLSAPPWGASVVGVRALALDVAAEGRRPGQLAPRTSNAQLESWIASGAALVAARTGLAGQLPASRADAGATWLLTGDEANVLRAHLVELYAAALLLDITHPTAASGRPAGAPLRERFTAELDGLRADLTAAATAGANDAQPGVPGVQGEGASSSFPAAAITRTTGF